MMLYQKIPIYTKKSSEKYGKNYRTYRKVNQQT